MVFNIAQLDTLPVRSSELMAANHTDPQLSKVLQYVRKGWPKKISDTLCSFWRRSELTVEGDSVLWGVRVVILVKLRYRVLEELHQGHPGVVRMKSLACSHVWWPELDREIEDQVKACMSCQAVKHAPAKALLHPWAWPTALWEHIHVNFAGPVAERMLFIDMDAHSKCPEVCAMNSTTAGQTVAVLREMFACNGILCQVVSDNGPQFISEEYFLASNGVKHLRCAPLQTGPLNG